MLTNEELCLLAQSGNADARLQLLQDNMKFYTHIANSVWEKNRNRYQSVGIGAEDLLQEGLMKLDGGIDTYRSDRGADFLTYIRHVLHNAMVDYARRECLSNSLQSDLSLNDEKNKYLQILEDPRFEAPLEAVIREENRQALAGAWKELPERQKVYMRYRFGLLNGEEQTAKNTAKHFHISVSRGKREEREAIRFLRREYAGRPLPGEPDQELQLEPDPVPYEEEPCDTFYESENDYEAFGPLEIWPDEAETRYGKLWQELDDSDVLISEGAV